MAGLVTFAAGICTEAVHAAGTGLFWYYDGIHRYLKLSLEDFGKVHLEIRTVNMPGEASRWVADGERTDKEITFSRSVGEDEARGTFYVATGGDASVKVKLKPGQDKKVMDEGMVGLYHRLSDDKRLFLAKHEFEGAEKRLQEAEKLAGKNWNAAEKPVLAEWKTRWPTVRDRILSLRDKYKPPGEAAAKPRLGLPPPNAETPLDKQPDRWFYSAELTAGALAFLTSPADPKTTPTWEGDYNDGFGGTINLSLEKDGNTLHFNLNCSRGNDEQTGMVSGNAQIAKDGLTADFTDQNPEVKEPSAQATLHLHRIGRYLIVDAAKMGKYTTRGWFDGVYRKQPPPAPAE